MAPQKRFFVFALLPLLGRKSRSRDFRAVSGHSELLHSLAESYKTEPQMFMTHTALGEYTLFGLLTRFSQECVRQVCDACHLIHFLFTANSLSLSGSDMCSYLFANILLLPPETFEDSQRILQRPFCVQKPHLLLRQTSPLRHLYESLQSANAVTKSRWLLRGSHLLMVDYIRAPHLQYSLT